MLAIIDGVVGRMEAEYVLNPSYLNDDNVTRERPIAPKGRVGDRLRKTREAIAALKPEKQ